MSHAVFTTTANKDDMPNPMNCELVMEGKMKVTTTLIVKLQRKGNRIDMKFTTVQLEVAAN